MYVLYSFCTDEHPHIHAVGDSAEALQGFADRMDYEETHPLTTIEPRAWERDDDTGWRAKIDADGHCWLYIVAVPEAVDEMAKHWSE